MPRQLHLEGPLLEQLLQQARDEHGEDVRVLSAQRVRSGGLGGFFARERFEVTVQVPDPTDSHDVHVREVPTTRAADRNGVPNGVANDVPNGVPNDVPNDVPNGVPNDVPNDVPNGVPTASVAGGLEHLLAAADRADVGPAAALVGAVGSSLDSYSASSMASAPGSVTSGRRPGRTLSTETPGFDDVLAALRADLLGHGTTEALDRTLPHPPGGNATTTSWTPSTVIAEPAPQQAPDTHEVRTSEAAPAPAAEDLVPGLVALARIVGADATRASVAAADVASSGANEPRHLLPLLAAALADDLARCLAADPRRVGVDGAEPDLLSARAGELVVVVGAPATAVTTAREVAEHLGTQWLATWSDIPADRPRRGALVLGDTRGLPAMLGRARAAGQPLVVALADPSLEPRVSASAAGTARAAVLRRLDPDLVVLAVEADASARRQATVTSRVAVAYGVERSLFLALVGCRTASAPLVHADRPVALLDGRPATVGAWTGVLLDALRWAEHR